MKHHMLDHKRDNKNRFYHIFSKTVKEKIYITALYIVEAVMPSSISPYPSVSHDISPYLAISALILATH